MVSEMRKARQQAMLPRLAIGFHRLGPTVITTAVKNVGPGAALAVDTRLIYEPSGDGERVERRWRANMLAPGEQHDFMPPGELQDNLNSLPATYAAVRLVGTMRDALGNTHEVDEIFDDLAEWREVLHGAIARWVYPDPETRMAHELSKRFKEPLARLTGEVHSIAGELRLARESPPGQAD
jgi:hypothetical protein